MAVHAKVEARRRDEAIVEVQAVRVITVRRSRPIVAGASDTAQTAEVVEAKTRSRVPDSRGRTKLAGKIHAFVGTII